MVDFRFHLISIIAVLLALAVGILTGSGFLGDALVKDLERRIEEVRENNDALHAEIVRLKAEADVAESFATTVEPVLIADRLRGTGVILIAWEGTPGSVVDGARGALEASGASVPLSLRLSNRFALVSDAERDQLALILRSVQGDRARLRAAAGRALGTRIASAAATGARTDVGRLERTLDELEDAGFVAVERDTDLDLSGATRILVVGGNSDGPAFDPSEMILSLTAGLDSRGSEALVAEPSDSAWELVEAIRSDDQMQDEVSTVDNVETVVGRIAVIMELERAEEGLAGHFGRQEGAAGVIPQPTPGE